MSILTTAGRWLAHGVVSLVIAIVALELISALIYFGQNGWSRPPWLGGPPLQSARTTESYAFDPLTLYGNASSPLAEGLYARPDIVLPQREPDEYRVFVVGGSTVAEVRKPPGERLPDAIAASLKVEGRSVRAFNFGVPSYTSYQEAELAIGKLVHLQPDMIVVYDGANDFFYGAVVRPELWQPNLTDVTQHYRARFEQDIQHQMTVAQRLNYLLEAASYTKALVDRLLLAPPASSVTAREWADRLAQNRETECQAQPQLRPSHPVFAGEARLNEAAIDVYATNIAAMAEAAALRGVAFVHVLQPQALTKTKLYPCERNAIERDNLLYRNYTGAILASYAAARVRLDALKAQRAGKVLFADLSRFIDGIDRYLYDDTMHAWRHGDLPNIMGAEIARLATPLTR